MTPKEEQAQRLTDMFDVLKTHQGQRVIWEIMENAGLMSRIPELEHGQSQRALGKRESGLEVHDWVMEASPSAFLKMLEKRAEQMENNK